MVDLTTTTKQYLRIDEFMLIFGVSRRTVYNWRKSGKLAFIYVGQQCRITVVEARRIQDGLIDLSPRSHKISQLGQPHVLAS